MGSLLLPAIALAGLSSLNNVSAGCSLRFCYGCELACFGATADLAWHDCLLGKWCQCSLTAREVVVRIIQGSAASVHVSA